jgi:AbrB family looped-hinge helix DNA binding protein
MYGIDSDEGDNTAYAIFVLRMAIFFYTLHFVLLSYKMMLCKIQRRYAMQTAVTKRGQTVIPAAIRKRYHIEEGDSLVWLDDGATIRVVPVARDPIQALRGSGRGERLVEALLAVRAEDRTHDG